MSAARPLDRRAHALGAFRVLPDGRGRLYTATTFRSDPYAGCDQTIRFGRRIGALADSGGDGPRYAVLDVFDAEGNIIQDYTITTAKGFQKIKRWLRLRVEFTDGDDVHAYMAACDARRATP